MSDQDNAYQEKVSFVREARRMMPLFKDPSWVASSAQEDERHVIDFAEAIVDTRENFPNLAESTAMHMVLGEGDKILAYIGNTSDAAERAKFITGLLHCLPKILDEFERMSEQDYVAQNRINELLESNSEKLLENRAQREVIRQQEAKINWLLSCIPGVEHS